MLNLNIPNRYGLKELTHQRRLHLLLLLLWLAIGTTLRFTRLSFLPPWTDECATIVFSLGHSFQTVPLNEWINSDTLLQPLQPQPITGVGKVIERLMAESTHPPVYFALAHWWMQLFPTETGLVSLWGARSLSAVFGVLSIPAIFGFAAFAFQSVWVGHMAAAMMAVSPYGIFLAHEARHYTLVILLVIASLYCFVSATQHINDQKPLPLGVGLAWVGINSLGMATHYFFALTLCAEGIVLCTQAWHDRYRLVQPYWQRIYTVALGTLIGCLVWLPAFQTINGSEPTTWIYDGNPIVEGLAPIGRLVIWVLSMVWLFPSAVSLVPLELIIISGLLTFILFSYLFPSLYQGFKLQKQNPTSDFAIQVLGGYTVAAITLVLGLTYGLGMDLTLGARFQFMYFPALITLLGAILAGVWQRTSLQQDQPIKETKKAEYVPLLQLLTRNAGVVLAMIGLMGFLGGLTVIWNISYLQNHRPDRLAPIIQKASHHPIFIATTHKHHGQTGRMMGLAWEFKRTSTGRDWTDSAQFFLAHRDSKTRGYQKAVQELEEKLNQLPRPFDLWLVDFRANIDLKSQHCVRDSQYGSWAGEYKYKLYRCLNSRL